MFVLISHSPHRDQDHIQGMVLPTFRVGPSHDSPNEDILSQAGQRRWSWQPADNYYELKVQTA